MYAEARDFLQIYLEGVVGERSNCGEGATVRSAGAIGSENVGLSSAQC